MWALYEPCDKANVTEVKVFRPGVVFESRTGNIIINLCFQNVQSYRFDKIVWIFLKVVILRLVVSGRQPASW